MTAGTNAANYWQPTTHFKPERYQVWLEQANFDLQAANISYEAGYYEWASFQCEQSLEKCLKAVLVHSGIRAPRIHKLGILLGMANQANPAFAHVKVNFRRMESYTFLSRYPFLVPGQNSSPHEFISASNARECIAIATETYNTITSFLLHAGKNQSPPIVHSYFTAEDVEARIRYFVDQVKSKFDVEKVILFGGFARNREQSRHKTMDMLVVANTEMPFIERISTTRELIKGDDPIIEPLIYTPHELNQLVQEEGEGFLESAIDEGVVVYQK